MIKGDDHLARDGRVIEVLSEHQCEGWLEGYLLTGRHGLFNSYEAFIHIIDSMFNQHAKWLQVTRRHLVAATDRVAEHLAGLARVAARSQRLHAPGPGLYRRGDEQEGVDRARLSAAGCQLPAVGGRSLLEEPALRQHRRGGQASRAAMAVDGSGREALHRRRQHLGIRQQRRRRRPRPGDGGRRRCAHAGNPGRDQDAARASAGTENPHGERRRLDEAAAHRRTSARPVRQGFRFVLYATSR